MARMLPIDPLPQSGDDWGYPEQHSFTSGVVQSIGGHKKKAKPQRIGFLNSKSKPKRKGKGKR